MIRKTSKNQTTTLTQTSIMDFILKGKKRLNSTQLTPVGSKKIKNRDIATNWERNITIVKDLIDEMIYSDFPLIISPIVAHLGTQKTGKPTNK